MSATAGAPSMQVHVGLMVRVASADPYHRSLDDRAHSLDDVAVGHRDAYDRLTACGRPAGEEGALSFQNADEPMKSWSLMTGV